VKDQKNHPSVLRLISPKSPYQAHRVVVEYCNCGCFTIVACDTVKLRAVINQSGGLNPAACNT
jgi:hypothetical protein